VISPVDGVTSSTFNVVDERTSSAESEGGGGDEPGSLGGVRSAVSTSACISLIPMAIAGPLPSTGCNSKGPAEMAADPLPLQHFVRKIIVRKTLRIIFMTSGKQIANCKIRAMRATVASTFVESSI